MPKSMKRRRNTYMVASILLVAFLFSYYFFTYIPAREDQMNERGIRVMNRMDKSIQDRIDHYKTTVREFPCVYYSKNYLLSNRGKATPDSLINGYFNLFSCNGSTERIVERINKIADSLAYKYNFYSESSESDFYNELLNQTIYSLEELTDPAIENFNAGITDKENVVLLRHNPPDSTSGVFVKTTDLLAISFDNLLKGLQQARYFDDVVLIDPKSDEVLTSSNLALKFFKYVPSVSHEFGVLDTVSALIETKNKEGEVVKNDLTGIYHIPDVDITQTIINNKSYYCFTLYIELDNKPYYLTGLINKDKYLTNVRQVSIWVVLVIVLLVLFLIQILPIVKPFILSKKERLRGADIMWSALALVFGISVFALIIIGYDTFSIEEQDLVDQELEIHNNRIVKDFAEELDKAVDQAYLIADFGQKQSSFLKELDSVYFLIWGDLPDEELFDAMSGIDEKLSAFSAEIERLEKDAEYLSIADNGLATFFKVSDYYNRLDKMLESDPQDSLTALDSLIDRVYVYATLMYNLVDTLNPSLDISHRGYYQNMRGRTPENAWYRTPDTPYFIESLFSLSGGTYKTILGIKSTKNGFTYAVDYPWKSVNSRYIEPGYSFCVIDKQGTIHYHTDQENIKNENFLEEADFNVELGAYLHNSAKSPLGLRFYMKDYRAYVSPLEGTPWYVVTMYDIRKSRLNITQSIMTTFQVIIFLLLYLLLLHVALKIQGNVLSHGHNRNFSYLFLSPVNASPRVYTILAAFNAFLVLLLMLLYAFNPINLVINITVFFGLLTMGILINYVVITKYSLTQSNLAHIGQSHKVSGFEWLLLLLWLMWFVLTYSFDFNNGVVAFIQVLQVALLVCYNLFKVSSPFKSFFLSTGKRSTFKPFYAHTFSWVIMVGVISVFLFFKPVYNMQHIKRGINNWIEEFDYKNNSNFTEQPDSKFNLFEIDTTRHVVALDSSLFRFSSQFHDALTLYFDEDEISLLGQGQGNTPIIVKEGSDSTGMPVFKIELNRASLAKLPNVPNPNTIVAFDLPSIDHAKEIAKALLFWLIILLSLWVIYATIKALSQKYFYLNLLNRLRAVSAEVAKQEASLESVPASHLNRGDTNLMLVGTPYSGRNRLANGIIQNLENRKYLDFLNNLEDELAKVDTAFVEGPIIINNFDYRISDVTILNTRLQILEKIIRLRNENQINEYLVLISNFGTTQLMELFKGLRDQFAAAGDKAEVARLDEAIYRWESVLFGFSTYTVKLKHQPSSDFLKNELSFGNALPALEPQIRAFMDQLEKQRNSLSKYEINEQIIELIMEMAQNYYYAIWNACSKAEKFMLFDLAQDGLVNSRNERVLAQLVRKGILLTDPTLRLFNASFARFVLDNISEEEGTSMEIEARKEGLWNTYQYLVIFLVIVMIVFLTFVEQSLIDKMTGFVTAGGLLLPKVISMFDSVKNSTWFPKKSST